MVDPQQLVIYETFDEVEDAPASEERSEVRAPSGHVVTAPVSNQERYPHHNDEPCSEVEEPVGESVRLEPRERCIRVACGRGQHVMPLQDLVKDDAVDETSETETKEKAGHVETFKRPGDRNKLPGASTFNPAATPSAPSLTRRSASVSPASGGNSASVPRALVLRAFSAYYIGTGLWPLLHLRSFLAVTGPKSEIWLLKTFSALITAVGVALGRASVEPSPPPSAWTLAVGSAAALGGADVWYVLKHRISPVYLLDAVIQGLLIATMVRSRSDRTTSRGQGLEPR